MELDIDRSYFFDEGIKFECRQCGQCCTGAPGTVYVAPDEIAAIADYLQMAEEDFRRYLYPFRDSYSITENDEGRCFFYDEGCSIYPVRPVQCRTFPFWLHNLRSESAWTQNTSECPGIGHGRLYTRKEILDQLWF